MATKIRTIETINPATEEHLETFDPFSREKIDGVFERAHRTYVQWRGTTLEHRGALMHKAAGVLRAQAQEFAQQITLEMGKTIAEAEGEIEKCAWNCDFYADNAVRFLSDERADSSASESFVAFRPLGVILAVMPWNFPFWQVFRFAAPALMAGNVGLLKHASNVPQCALAIEDVIRRAGFPADVFQTLLITSSQVGRVLDDPRVKAASLTGSEAAGAQVASQAGRQIKKTVLELGGSDPFVVMPSADLDRAATVAAEARTINNGQSCIAAKRFIADATVYADFERRFVAAMEALRVGDPMDEATQIGPLATPAILDDLDSQVRRSVEKGPRVLTGGHRLDRPGNYYAPTILADVPPEAPAYREELFGPVAVLLRSNGIADAVRLANDTEFGLGASAWTTDPAEQQTFIDEIESGMVFLNGMVASDARLPFGGVKRSGYGRELSAYGIREFVNVKTVRVL
jgi:succinate-semialdehyde dehydrogenase / glutarate-semialdehyde dehydrogenase